jgi:hypothetical protein
MRRSVVGLIALLALAAAAAPAEAGYQFAAQTSAGLASRAEQIAGADFDGDGDLDLASATCAAACGGTGTGNVTLMQNSGSGTFTTSTLTAGSGPQWIVARDFGNDGDADLAVANTNSQDVTIFGGNGNNTFAAPTTTSLVGNPRGLDFADIDGDGDKDLIAPIIGSNVVQIKDNAGGTFNTIASLIGAIDARGVMARDFDGDGDPDIATILGSTGRLVVYTNSGGGYGSGKLDGVGGTPVGFTAGDFNGDNDLDVAVAASNTSVAVLLGATGTTFGDVTNYPAPAGSGIALGIATRDMDGDGDLDLVTRNAGTGVSIFDGKGDGTFAAAGSATAVAQGTPGASGVVLGDLTGDGYPDAAVLNGVANSVSPLKAVGVAAVQPFTDFDDQTVGTRSAPKTLTETNAGSGPMTLAAPSFTGAAAGDYQSAGTCGGPVLPGETCGIAVRFAPSATGTRAASMSLAQVDLPAALITAALSGIGTTPPAPVVGPTGQQGPAGSNGTNGATGGQGSPGTNGTNGVNGALGPAGATGPQGRAGRDATVTCRPVGTKKVKVTCTVRLATARTTSLRLVRGRTLYATGRVSKSGATSLRRTRPLTPGRYTLEVKSRGKTTKQTVVVSRP